MPKRTQEFSVNREISISEFFEKNRHILGFDSPIKSLFMIVKEALDNSLDACEEYGIIPEISVSIERLEKDEYRITIEDNGPGIDRKDVPSVFGKLLYGSRFHGMRQSRGQQGIGITASVMYGQITTGKPTIVTTRKEGEDVGYYFELGINIKENSGRIFVERPIIMEKIHGTSVSITAKGKYQVGRQSVIEYLKETAAVNPNMELRFTDPDNRVVTFKRVVAYPSRKSIPVKPFPPGLELGEIQQMGMESKYDTMIEFLSQEFSRVSKKTALEILQISGIPQDMKPSEIDSIKGKSLMNALTQIKLMNPPVESLSPLGSDFIRKGLRNVYGEINPSFYSKPVMRPPAIFNGNPFSVEVGIVYGGDLPADQQVNIIRYANKVPLLFQPGACAITRAVAETDWRSYGLDQRSGTGIPFGPMMILVHVFGTRLPFTSESKEAIAGVPEIVEEIKNALRISGRSLKTYMNKKERRIKVMEKYRIVSEIIPEIARKAASVTGNEVPGIDDVISKIANVMLVTEDFLPAEEGISVQCRVFNYTTVPRSIKIYPDPPAGELYGDQKAWDLNDIPPSGSSSFSFKVSNVEGKYDGTVYYFEGQDVTKVQGADPLPGDWNIQGVSMIQESAADDSK